MELDSHRMYLRQQDIFDREKASMPILVIGAGSLGSWTVLGLAKLGFKDITVWDNDKVELHNIPNQFFTPGDAEESEVNGPALKKVVALWSHTEHFTGITIVPCFGRFTHQAIDQELVIVTPDNMQTRKSVFMRCIGHNKVKYFIDGRMGGQAYRVYANNPNNTAAKEFYLSKWIPDSQGAEEECTARGVGYNAVMCAMEIVNIAKRCAMGQDIPKEIIADSGGMWREVNW